MLSLVFNVQVSPLSRLSRTITEIGGLACAWQLVIAPPMEAWPCFAFPGFVPAALLAKKIRSIRFDLPIYNNDSVNSIRIAEALDCVSNIRYGAERLRSAHLFCVLQRMLRDQHHCLCSPGIP